VHKVYLSHSAYFGINKLLVVLIGLSMMLI
jgi:hypothetical protein